MNILDMPLRRKLPYTNAESMYLPCAEAVPHVELCKTIPDGHFPKSMFVWVEDDEGVYLTVRDALPESVKGIPAPTVEDCLRALCASLSPRLPITCHNGRWFVNVLGAGGSIIDIADQCLVTAMLNAYITLKCPSVYNKE